MITSKLSSNRAAKLYSLDGKEMANWISGYHINKYNNLLTIEELE